MEADVRGRFVWHQLMTRDVAGAKMFYSKVAGWKALPWPLDTAYTVCHSDSGPVAGIVGITSDFPADTPSHWLQYIGTRDVDGTAEAAVRAGGSIVTSARDMKGAGRYAVLKDPQGAVFAIIDPENARPQAQGVPPLGTFSWHELATSDHEAAFAFYSALFGWDAMARMDMGPTVGIYLIFGENGVQRGGMYVSPPENTGPPNWLPYAHIPDADKAFEVALSAGAKTLTPPMEVPGGGRIAMLTDPAGAAFAVQSMPVSGSVAVTAEKPKAVAKVKARSRAKPKPKAKRKSQGRRKSKTAPKKKPASRKKSKTVRKKK